MLHRRRLLAMSTLLAYPAASFAAEDGLLSLKKLYLPGGGFAPYALARDGSPVVVPGYMAPPLRAQSTFFILTARPMSVCPFCDTEAEWPNDILAVYTRRIVAVTPFYKPVRAEGILRLGSFTDPDTAFVSMVRLDHAVVAPV